MFCLDFDEEDADLTSILNDLSQIQESMNKSQDGMFELVFCRYTVLHYYNAIA